MINETCFKSFENDIYNILFRMMRILFFVSLFIPILSCIHTIFDPLTSQSYSSEYCVAPYFITYMNGVRSRALLGTLFSFLFPHRYFTLCTCIIWYAAEEILIVLLYRRISPLASENSNLFMLYAVLFTAISFFPMTSTLFHLRSDLFLLLCYVSCVTALHEKKLSPGLSVILCSVFASFGILIHPVFFLSYVPFLITYIHRQHSIKKCLAFCILLCIPSLFILLQPKTDFPSLSSAVHAAQDETDYNEHIIRYLLSDIDNAANISDTTDSFLYSSYCSNGFIIPIWRLNSVFPPEFIQNLVNHMLLLLPMLIPSLFAAIWLFRQSSDRFDHLIIILFFGVLFLTQLDFVRWILMFVSASAFLDRPHKEPSRRFLIAVCSFHCLAVFFSLRALI